LQWRARKRWFCPSRLARNEKVAVNSFIRKHSDLNRGRPVVVALGESASERRTCGRK
jgi:hypothetical protein